jgi:hypothetical protein
MSGTGHVWLMQTVSIFINILLAIHKIVRSKKKCVVLDSDPMFDVEAYVFEHSCLPK